MTTSIDLTPVQKALEHPKKLPKNIKRAFLDWVDFVLFNGIEVAQRTKRFKDHTLKGQRKGQRSVYLDKKWRAIYSLTNGKVKLIRVEEITPHDYKVK